MFGSAEAGRLHPSPFRFRAHGPASLLQRARESSASRRPRAGQTHRQHVRIRTTAETAAGRQQAGQGNEEAVTIGQPAADDERTRLGFGSRPGLLERLHIGAQAEDALVVVDRSQWSLTARDVGARCHRYDSGDRWSLSLAHPRIRKSLIEATETSFGYSGAVVVVAASVVVVVGGRMVGGRMVGYH